MSFTAKRGRPKTKPIGRISDFGTEQLQAKRRQNITIEPFDLLKQKSLISDEQHWAGLHLRWLYTLKMGAPNISASNLDEFYGRELRAENDDWREQREAEYDFAITALQKSKALKTVTDIAIFGVIKLPLCANDLRNLREGLSLLCKIWGKKQK